MKNGVIMCAKLDMLHDFPLKDLTDMLKEEMNELKRFMKAQAVSHHSATITWWFIKLHLELDLTHYKDFYKCVQKEENFKPKFALVKKIIFNGEKDPKFTKSFMKKDNLRPKATHIEARQDQAL